MNACLLHLEKYAQKRAEAELVYALAELSWIEAKRLDHRRKPQAIDRFLDAAAYAYDYLFDDDPVLAEGRGPSDPRFRLAMEIYNAGVDRLIRAAQTKGQIQPQNGEAIPFKVHGREQSLRIVLKDSPWSPADVHKILLASDFEVSGINRDLSQYGLGVPLIAVRETGNKKGERPPQERFYPAEMAFPLTAFLVPNSRLNDANVDINEGRECTLWLLDPVRNAYGRRRSPTSLALEIDLTTPLAYMWSRTDLDRYRWTGLLRPEQALERANLLLIRPYEPGKIPVVMVHGLISTPLAWIPMLNELLRDPVIQSKYQFMLYMYPTGVPIPIAAAGLRESLVQAKMMYDPDGRDPAFEQMVLLGHSMGGILSRTVAVSSGDQFWRLYSDRPFDEILGPARGAGRAAPLFLLRAAAVRQPGRFPGHAASRLGDVARGRGPRRHQPDFRSRPYPQAALPVGEAKPRRIRLAAISPVADQHRDARAQLADLDGALEHAAAAAAACRSSSTRSSGRYDRPASSRSTDGVVPYRSAHLDGVTSEKVVRSDHGVQKDPEAIREVRRILLRARRRRGHRPGRPGGPSIDRRSARRLSWKCPSRSGKVLVLDNRSGGTAATEVGQAFEPDVSLERLTYDVHLE